MAATVLVTGATGFIGRALSAWLEADGALVLKASQSLGQDLTDASALEPLLHRGIDMVYHAAARTFVPTSWETPSDFYRVNVIGTQTVLDFCRRVGARLIYLSTYVYGRPQYLPVDEDHPVRPSNPYAHSKWLGEELCRYYFEAWQVPVTIVRPFNAYGVGQDSRFLIPSIVRQWVRDRRVRVQDLSPRRDLVYVSDLVEACVAASETGTKTDVFNVGSGRSASVRDIIAALEGVVGEHVAFEETGRRRPDEISDVVADCRLVRDARWRPKTSLEEGLERMLRWATENSDR